MTSVNLIVMGVAMTVTVKGQFCKTVSYRSRKQTFEFQFCFPSLNEVKESEHCKLSLRMNQSNMFQVGVYTKAKDVHPILLCNFIFCFEGFWKYPILTCSFPKIPKFYFLSFNGNFTSKILCPHLTRNNEWWKIE